MSKSPDRPFLPAALAGAVIALAVGTLLLAHGPQPPAAAAVRPVAQTTPRAQAQSGPTREHPEHDEHDEDDD